MAQARGRTMDVTFPSDEEILITRTVAAPPHLVFRAWTTPELVSRWWPGRRGEMTVAEMDFRVGGKWRYVMLAHGETQVAFHGTYREIVPDRRIVHTEVMEFPDASEGSESQDTEEGAVVNTVTFEASDDGAATTVSILTHTGSKEVRDMIAQSGMEGGVREQFEIIEEIAAALH